MNTKKILQILVIGGFMVSLVSLILPSRLWQKALQAESIPPCGEGLKAFSGALRRAGNTGLAAEVEEYVPPTRFSLEDGSTWATPDANGNSAMGVSKDAFLSPPACPRPEPNRTPPTPDRATPPPNNLTRNAWDRNGEALNENGMVSTTTLLKTWH